MVVSPRCLERGLSSTPSHHQCEGRPPAFQASRATRATNSAVASAACLDAPRGPRSPICGRIKRPAFPAPSELRVERSQPNSRASVREIAKLCLEQRHCEERSDEAIQFFRWQNKLDCFAEPVIGRAFARPVGSHDVRCCGCLKIESVAQGGKALFAPTR